VLSKALNDSVPKVSFAAARALFTLHDPAGKSALLAVLSGENKVPSGFISKQMCDALRMLHTPARPLRKVSASFRSQASVKGWHRCTGSSPILASPEAP
jgi:hypothetical protein